MLGNWQDWCRFCTNTNTASVYKMVSELENVNKYFKLSLAPLDGIELSVCQECCGFLTKLDGFRDRCLKADQMFKELMSQEVLTEMRLKSIRVKHGLEIEEAYLPSLLGPTFVSCTDSHDIEIGDIVVVKTENPDELEVDLPPHFEVSTSSPAPAKKTKLSEEVSSTPAISSLQTYIAKELREYFRTQRKVVVNGSSLLKKTTLNDSDRKKAMQIVANHLLMCRPEPKKFDLVAYAKASIELFPMLKIDSELGYDAVYSPAKRCGFLGNVVKNMRERKRAEMKFFDNCDKDDEEEETETDPFEDREIEMERLKEELKVTPAFQHNTQQIIEGMAKTYEHRRKLVMSSSKTKILLEYPRFVDTYGLVQNDFEKCYPDRHLNLKTLYKKEFQEMVLHMGNQKVISLETKDWGLPELAALCWVSLAPPTSNGRVRCPSLKEAFDCLLKHQLESEEPQFKSSPTIIAQGDAKNNIKKYFVALNGQSIPTNDTFVDALDIFFKVHFVFDLEFDIALRNFLVYIEHYVFEIRKKGKKHTTNTTVNKCRMMLRTSENADV